MGLNKYKRVIRFAVLAALAMTVAIGCGDGNPKKRQPVRKNPNAGTQGKIDPKTGKPTTNPSKPSDPTKSPTEETEAERQKKVDEARKKDESEKRFDGMIAALITGLPLMDKSRLEEGVYNISQFTVSLKYMATNGGWMRAFRSQSLRIDAADKVDFGKEAAEGLGAAANDPDASGRALEVPMVFEVKKEGGVFRGERSAFQRFVLIHNRVTSEMNSKGDFKVDVVNTPGEANASRSTVKASVADLLATNAIEEAGKDLKYSVTENGKQIDLRLYKVSETKIRVVFEIMEIKDTMIRTVALDYDLTKAAAPAGMAAPAPADPDAATVEAAKGAAPAAPAVPAGLPTQDEDQAR